MVDVVFSREEFADGTVLYHVDVEDALSKKILFTSPESFDTVEQAEEYVTRALSGAYEDARWVYVLLENSDFVEA